MTASLKTSFRMALFLGIFLPLAETVRRIPEILAFQNFFRWFDDYLLGIILLLAAYAVYKQKQNSSMYLIAAWGVAAGALAGSLCEQFDAYFKNLADAGVFSSGFVLVGKALFLFYILIGLQQAIKATQLNSSK